MADATRAREWKREERRADVAKLHARGWSVRRIAAALGVGKSTVAEDVDALLAELVSVRIADCEKARESELEKLASCEAAALDIVLQAEQAPGELDPDVVMRACDRVVKIQERRAKLLGLDAPEKLDATLTEGPSPQAAARLVREVFAVKDTHGGADDGADSGAAEAAEPADS